MSVGVRIATLLALLALLLPASARAEVRAWLDRETVALGDTVTLNVESDDAGAEPDFTPLEANFRLLGTSSRSQVSIVNGQTTTSTLWAVAMEPRDAGVIGIPGIVVGNERTDPLTLTVLPAPAGGTGAAGDDVYLEVEATPEDPYVQQQVRYVVRLFYAVTLLEGQLEEPAVDGAEVRRLGQDRSFQRVVADRRYNVVERHYALIPERSGTLEVPGPRFRGRALRPGRMGFSLNPGETVNARGDAVALAVKPRPANAATPWLPADSLTLDDDSGDLPEEIAVGEPLTLTLRLAARGLGPAQLPDLELPPIDGAQVYPDQPDLREGQDPPWLTGERVRKFAVVPTRPGELRIPAIEIGWWNTDADRAEVARVPARTVRVVAAPGAASDTPPAGTDAALPPDDADAATDPAPLAGSPWPWLALAFAALWLVTLIAWWRRPAPVVAAPAPAPRSAQDAPGLSRALAEGDLDAIARALIAAARREGRSETSLGALAPHFADAAQREAAFDIERARFGDGDRKAAVSAAAVAFRRGPRFDAPRADTARADGPLPPLYRHTRDR